MAPLAVPWTSPADGYVTRIAAYPVGVAAVELGAGRERLDDGVDPAVGLEVLARVGDAVEEGEPIAVIHARSEESAASAGARLAEACRVSPRPPEDPPPLVWKRVGDAAS